jgi:hypothetical protein
MSDRIAEIRARLDAATTLPVSPHSVTLFPIDRKRDEKAERAFIANAPADIAWLLDEVERVRAWGRDWQRAYMGLERKAGFGLAEDEMDEALS